MAHPHTGTVHTALTSTFGALGPLKNVWTAQTPPWPEANIKDQGAGENAGRYRVDFRQRRGRGKRHSLGGYSIGGANFRAVPCTLRAFDAADLSREIWNSRQNIMRDDLGLLAKFNTPVVANGKVYVATFSKQVAVYGLLPDQAPSYLGDPVNASPVLPSE